MDDEDLICTLKENFPIIICKSIILFGLFPMIKWAFWSSVYFFIQNDWVLNRLVETTFIDNVIPWYLGIFINFKESLIVLILSFLIIWVIYGIMESYKK